MIKPHHFSEQESTAINTAMRFAIEGDLIFKYGTELQPKSQLIIVPAFGCTVASESIEQRIEKVLKRYNVKTVPANQLDAFAEAVLQQAHA
ncbi:MAG: hypothetical protein JNM18_10290 [Planctomycetaceae bacterium]|nr:hypothetical protein [Planctomycetaceae bacterium]